MLFLLISFPNIANSLTSSSYLITNEAILSFDYETASKYYDKDHLADSSISLCTEPIERFWWLYVMFFWVRLRRELRVTVRKHL